MIATKSAGRKTWPSLRSVKLAHRRNGLRRNDDMLRRERRYSAQARLPPRMNPGEPPRGELERAEVAAVATANRGQATSNLQLGPRPRVSCLSPPTPQSQHQFLCRRKKRALADRARRTTKRNQSASLVGLSQPLEVGEASLLGEVDMAPFRDRPKGSLHTNAHFCVVVVVAVVSPHSAVHAQPTIPKLRRIGY